MFKFEIVKKVDFEKASDGFSKQLEALSMKQAMQMKHLVEQNLVKHGNVDTTTLYRGLRDGLEADPDGSIGAFVESDTTAYPTGAKVYAEALEANYPNFIPAVQDQFPVFLDKLSDLKLKG